MRESCANGACGEGCDASDGACGEGDPGTEPLSPLSQCASYDKLNRICPALGLSTETWPAETFSSEKANKSRSLTLAWPVQQWMR